MASTYFENYSTNLRRIFFAELVEDLKTGDDVGPQGERSFEVYAPRNSNHLAAMRESFKAMEWMALPERRLDVERAALPSA